VNISFHERVPIGIAEIFTVKYIFSGKNKHDLTITGIIGRQTAYLKISSLQRDATFPLNENVHVTSVSSIESLSR
jgi:hypothetical protein